MAENSTKRLFSVSTRSDGDDIHLYFSFGNHNSMFGLTLKRGTPLEDVRAQLNDFCQTVLRDV